MDFGLTFDGEVLFLDENSFYITDIGLYRLYNWGVTHYGVLTDEGEVADISTLYDARHWVGRYIVYKDSSNEKGYSGNPYRIAGVVDTSSVPRISQGALPDYFCKPNFNGNHYMYDFSCNYKNASEVFLNFDQSSTAEQFTFKSQSSMVRAALTKGGMWRYDETSGDFTSAAYEFDLKDDEIMISYELCDKIFGMKSKLYYTAQDFQDLQLPEFLGQYFDLSFSDYFTNKELLNVGKMKIAGIFFADTAVYECVVSPKQLGRISSYLQTGSRAIIKTDSVDDLSGFLQTFRKDYGGMILNMGSSDTGGSYMSWQYDFETKDMLSFKIIIPAIAAILCVVLFFATVDFVSYDILRRKKEIGVLASLGMGKGEISKTCLSQVFIISAITFVANLILTLIALPIINAALSTKYSLVIPYFAIDGWLVLTLFVASFVFLTLAASIPLRKVLKMKPVDAIRGL